MRRSIQEMYNNFKLILKDDAFFYGVLIVLISVSSFGLGRWSIETDEILQAQNPEVTFLPASASSATESKTADDVVVPTETGEIMYVASKSGTKYHLLTCPGAKQIKEENKIFFTTKEDAQKSGYTPASNCKGI